MTFFDWLSRLDAWNEVKGIKIVNSHLYNLTPKYELF